MGSKIFTSLFSSLLNTSLLSAVSTIAAAIEMLVVDRNPHSAQENPCRAGLGSLYHDALPAAVKVIHP